MEHRQLGHSGLMVPVLCFGTATFGGGNDFFRKWGSTDVAEATRMLDLCLDAGVNFFDTADAYSDGLSEEILGQAIGSRRDDVLIATKAAFRTEPGPNGHGSSRHHLLRACEASLRRLRTDHIDLYQLHGFDALTPVEEVLRTLDDLVRTGKVRYVGCSNFSGWHLMKSLSIAERYGLPRYVSHQIYYSLVNREYEWELMPLALDQRVAAMIWSPLAQGQLTGKVRRGQSPPPGTRAAQLQRLPLDVERLYDIVDALDAIATETGRSISQVALNWLLQRPSVATIVIGARTEEQLRDNLAAASWTLSPEQLARLNEASATTPIYPYWHQQATLGSRNPLPVG